MVFLAGVSTSLVGVTVGGGIGGGGGVHVPCISGLHQSIRLSGFDFVSHMN